MVVEATAVQTAVTAEMKYLLLQKTYLQLDSRDIIRDMMMATEQVTTGNSTVFITMTKIIINQKMVRTLIKGAILKVMMKVIVKGKQRL